MDPIIWSEGSLVDPRIRVNVQVKSIFTDLERKGYLLVPKGIVVGMKKGCQ